MTIAEGLEGTLSLTLRYGPVGMTDYRLGYDAVTGVERLAGVKSLTFGDVTRAMFDDYQQTYFSNRVLDLGQRKSKTAQRVYKAMQSFQKETPYEFVVDAVALNLASIPFVLVDRVGQPNWAAAWGSRLVAAVGNTIVGRPIGAMQDRIIPALETYMRKEESKTKIMRGLKWWGARSGSFIVTSSWAYAFFLVKGASIAGEKITPEGVALSVAILTGASPLVGPLTDKMYQTMRVQFGLNPVSERRAQQIEEVKRRAEAA